MWLAQTSRQSPETATKVVLGNLWSASDSGDFTLSPARQVWNGKVDAVIKTMERSQAGLSMVGCCAFQPQAPTRFPKNSNLSRPRQAISENAWLSRNTPEVSSDGRFRWMDLNGFGTSD
jgi:hypothetical protein